MNASFKAHWGFAVGGWKTQSKKKKDKARKSPIQNGIVIINADGIFSIANRFLASDHDIAVLHGYLDPPSL